jgi:NAD(P)-dependent dehydrogenase (short-subunit alcohol dehydrogenase family)
MDLQLAGKRALVTGSSSGVGEAVARSLAAEGVTVVVHGRDVKRTQTVMEGIANAGGSAYAVTTDLTDEAATRTLSDEIESQDGGH